MSGLGSNFFRQISSLGVPKRTTNRPVPPIGGRYFLKGGLFMVQNDMVSEVLELFRQLSEEQQLIYLSRLRSLLAEQEQAPADPA